MPCLHAHACMRLSSRATHFTSFLDNFFFNLFNALTYYIHLRRCTCILTLQTLICPTSSSYNEIIKTLFAPIIILVIVIAIVIIIIIITPTP